MSAAVTRRRAQDGPDARHELLDAERLGDVVVAHAQPLDLVLGGVAGGEEDDRHLLALMAEPAADLEAVEVGKHDVEHDEMGRKVRTWSSASAPVEATPTW